jgi:hypothetical protein
MAEKRIIGLYGFLLLLAFASTAGALIEVHQGNEPMREAGLPTGAKAVADLPSRLGYQVGPPFGGGEYHFSYQSEDTDAFNRALALFSQIRVPRFTPRWLVSLTGQQNTLPEAPLLLLVIHRQASRHEEKRVDWTFTVWCPENYYSLFHGPKDSLSADHPNYRQPVPPPRIDVYLGDDCPIQWGAVQVPANLRIVDTRPTSGVNQKKGACVSGAIYDMATHQVVAQAELRIVKTARSGPTETIAQGRTNEQGAFELTGIAQGYYRVHVQAEGYVARDWGRFDNRSGHTRLDTDILLCRPASLTGQVVDQGGSPAPGLTVLTRDLIGVDGRGYACVDEPQAVTDPNGRFVIEGVPEGHAHLRCRAPSLHQENSIFELYRVSRRPWPRGQEIKLVVTGTGTIQGKVLDSASKPPTRQFIVELEPKGGSVPGSWGSSGQIKPDGSFDIKGIPPGEYLLVAKPNPMREGEATDPKSLVITAGRMLDLTLRAEHAHHPQR